MRLFNFERLFLTLLFFVVPIYSSAADIIYDTGVESIGTTGLSGGASVSGTQYIGARFQSSDNYSLTEIGGHFGLVPGGTIFGAVLALSSASAYPDLSDLENDPNLLAHSTINAPSPSGVTWSSISAELQKDSWYAVVFGSGIFGTAGEGYMPYENITVNTRANMFWYAPSTDFLGQPSPTSTLGYVGLKGLASVPIPAAAWLFGSGLVGLIAIGRRKKAA